MNYIFKNATGFIKISWWAFGLCSVLQIECGYIWHVAEIHLTQQLAKSTLQRQDVPKKASRKRRPEKDVPKIIYDDNVFDGVYSSWCSSFWLGHTIVNVPLFWLGRTIVNVPLFIDVATNWEGERKIWSRSKIERSGDGPRPTPSEQLGENEIMQKKKR